jgi:hypothetical protein
MLHTLAHTGTPRSRRLGFVRVVIANPDAKLMQQSVALAQYTPSTEAIRHAQLVGDQTGAITRAGATPMAEASRPFVHTPRPGVTIVRHIEKQADTRPTPGGVMIASMGIRQSTLISGVCMSDSGDAKGFSMRTPMLSSSSDADSAVEWAGKLVAEIMGKALHPMGELVVRGARATLCSVPCETRTDGTTPNPKSLMQWVAKIEINPPSNATLTCISVMARSLDMMADTLVIDRNFEPATRKLPLILERNHAERMGSDVLCFLEVRAKRQHTGEPSRDASEAEVAHMAYSYTQHRLIEDAIQARLACTPTGPGIRDA